VILCFLVDFLLGVFDRALSHCRPNYYEVVKLARET
jgi:hypothetical protein